MLSWEHSPSIAAMQCERAWVEIDVAALAHNVQQIRRVLSPQTGLMAVVKADAYGHGAVMVAKTVLQHGATWLGVATIPEGIELREAGIKAPILILGATQTAEQVRAIVRWQLQPTLCTIAQAAMMSEAIAHTPSSRSPLAVHLKLDTGMSRLGTPWQQALEFVQYVHRDPNLHIASIYSHLATADDPDQTIVHQQQQRFETALRQIQAAGIPLPWLHLANSAATLTDPRLHYDLVRVGLAIYGLYPAPHLAPSSSTSSTTSTCLPRITLQPVMQVKARITQVKTIAAGTGVSYGHRFIASRPTRVAVVGIGYADGVPRNLSGRMTVLAQGQHVPQIGTVTMDQLMIDVTEVPDLQEGDVVTLLGQVGSQRISADDWAATLGTISWEVLCGFRHRLPRIAVNCYTAQATAHLLS
ncbi:MAG: alanine racemase [Cyanobacteria bacterium]|nr:alanine racemase [Cyanobacteriota bacterium]MDW8203106.1 alanine racemase [Cyanobacteriota bacterium SKYGB_h_bin112]